MAAAAVGVAVVERNDAAVTAREGFTSCRRRRIACSNK